MIIRRAEQADASDLGLIMVSGHYSAFLGNLPEANLDFDWTPEMSADSWREWFGVHSLQEELFYVAEVDRQVVGLCRAEELSVYPGFDCIVHALYVLPSRHRQGIGRALLTAVGAECHDRGRRNMMIGCVRENPHCGFYRHLGGVEVTRRSVKVDRHNTEEIMFGWREFGPKTFSL